MCEACLQSHPMPPVGIDGRRGALPVEGQCHLQEPAGVRHRSDHEALVTPLDGPGPHPCAADPGGSPHGGANGIVVRGRRALAADVNRVAHRVRARVARRQPVFRVPTREHARRGQVGKKTVAAGIDPAVPVTSLDSGSRIGRETRTGGPLDPGRGLQFETQRDLVLRCPGEIRDDVYSLEVAAVRQRPLGKRDELRAVRGSSLQSQVAV